MKAIVAALSAAVLCSVSAANAGEISVGVTPVPHGEVMEFVKPIVAKQGVDLKIVEFNDYVQPNLATDDGELDANYFQHRPYLEEFTKDHGINLIEVATVHIEPMGVYSKQIKKINELKDGAVIAIPNDPTNGGRALLLLNKAGVITLEDPTDITATVMDIKDNPKNIEIRELEAAQLPRALEDVDAAVNNTNFAMQADLIPQRDAIVIEGADSPYVNILVANPDSAEKEDMKILIKAVQSEETKAFIEKQYKGAVLPAF